MTMNCLWQIHVIKYLVPLCWLHLRRCRISRMWGLASGGRLLDICRFILHLHFLSSFSFFIYEDVRVASSPCHHSLEFFIPPCFVCSDRIYPQTTRETKASLCQIVCQDLYPKKNDQC